MAERHEISCHHGDRAALIGFGHSFLAMSGYESLALVDREIESPKPLNLQRPAQFYDSLISGIAMNLAGPDRERVLVRIAEQLRQPAPAADT